MQKRFAIGVVILCLGYYVLECFNGRAQMADFRVYYDAANALLHGDLLYGKAFGVSSGFYKYSPFACIPFIPLALLPFGLASFFYYLLITAAIIWFSQRVSKVILGAETKAFIALPILTGLFLIDHLERELHLGNINLLLLIALFECYILLKSDRNVKGGALYGLVLLFKPHFLLLLPYLIWKKRLTSVLACFSAVGLGLLLPSAALGWQQNIQLLNQWGDAMSDHNLALQLSPNTIYGIINKVFLHGNAGAWLVLSCLAVVGSCIAYLILRNDRLAGKAWSAEVRFTEYFLLIALVPNLVHTDTEHFMWVWPILALAIFDVIKTNTPWQKTRITLLALAFIPFALNSPDIVGSKIRLLFDEGGLGLANVMILVCALMTNYELRISGKSVIRNS